ncbi:MAG: preprotein translocase subunit YajC [Pirellulaceae bacterium]
MDYIFGQLAVLATRFGAVILAQGEAGGAGGADGGAAEGGVPQASPGIGNMLMPMLLIFAVFYFIIIRPQGKQRRKQDSLRKNISLYNRVMTIGGIIGEVKEIKKGGENKPDEVVLEIDKNSNSRITVVRDAIRENLSASPDDLVRQDSSDEDKAE